MAGSPTTSFHNSTNSETKLQINDHSELIRTILSLEMDDPRAAFSFTDRLARENGWSIEKAVRAVQEYKRFICLIALTDTPLTPSDEVDQVWHLHLLYTRSYWHDLCRDILGFELHHGPTKGGSAERVRYDDQYRKTLARYREVFGAKAPDDLWPPADKRFLELRFRRVNLHRNWVFPKFRMPWRKS